MEYRNTERKIKGIMNRHGAGFSKKLGQHFLSDDSVLEEIAESAGLCEEDYVIEIGPGIGVLTSECAIRAGFLSAIEIDGKLIPILKETLSRFTNIEIIHQDILKVNLHELINKRIQEKQLEHVKIVGNLPYYITTPIIMKLLEERVEAESITIMMQKEVAQRLMAEPGSKAYGAITVAVQYYSTLTEVLQVPKEAFIPPPKVDSTVLRLMPRKEPPVILKNEPIFFEVIKASFGQRRKTLLNSLTGYQNLSKEETKGLLESVGIDPGRRAETLSMQEFADLANALCK